MVDWIYVGAGGIIGAIARYEFGRWSARHLDPSFPYATLLINFLGSLVIAVFLVWTTDRVLADPRWRLLVAIGFCGAFTTFSSFAFETLRLYERGSSALAIANIFGNNLAALTAVVAGAVIARKL